MPPEPTTSPQPPIAVLPLDYGSDSLDPLAPVIRTIARLLLVLGILSFVMQSYYALVMYNTLFNRVNGLAGGLYYIFGIPLSILEIIAGASNMKQLNLKWMWYWIWISIGIRGLEAVPEIIGDLMRVRHIDISFYASVLMRVIQIPLGCALALIVLVLLRYRSRTIAFDTPK
jgi:hypothetical protein